MGDFNKVPILSELPSNKSPAMEIAFVTDDVSAAYQKAIQAGAEPIAEPTQKPWGQSVCYVRDNNRFLVENLFADGLKMMMTIPIMIPIGYMAKRIVARPECMDAPAVVDIYFAKQSHERRFLRLHQFLET